jgi:hypothetical protein
LLTVGLDGLPHDGDFGINQPIQRGFLFLSEGRFGFQKNVAEAH